jgi:hypothetical protein
MVQTGNSIFRRQIFQILFVPGCQELRIPLGHYAALFTIEKIALGTIFEMLTIEQTGFTIFYAYLMDNTLPNHKFGQRPQYTFFGNFNIPST